MASAIIMTKHPIKWRFWLVYYRYTDGRIMFFRGAKRNSLYIQNLKCGKQGDWTWEEDFARLFQFEPIITQAATSKVFGSETRQTILQHSSYCGFSGFVLQSHLILPRG